MTNHLPGTILLMYSCTAGRRILEFVADDGDGDEDCLPVSTAEFGGPSGMGARHQRYC